MCIDCNERRITRRSFVTTASAAIGAAALGREVMSQQPAAKDLAIGDPGIVQSEISFKSGSETIKGYLARPKNKGKYQSVVIAQGNPGISDDIRNAAAQVAQAGFIGLVYDWGSIAPMPSGQQERARWQVDIFRYEFAKHQMRNLQSAIEYLKERPFTKGKRISMLGFCGGGRLALLFASQSKEVASVISFYGAVLYHDRKHKSDPIPDVMDVVKQIKVPVQGHYGMLDVVAPAADAKLFEQALRAQGTPVEMYYYEGAGHRFYNFTVPPGSDPGYDYNPNAAALAHKRMVAFLRKYSRRPTS
jgi:carboxymethylenebutenolidase